MLGPAFAIIGAEVLLQSCNGLVAWAFLKNATLIRIQVSAGSLMANAVHSLETYRLVGMSNRIVSCFALSRQPPLEADSSALLQNNAARQKTSPQ